MTLQRLRGLLLGGAVAGALVLATAAPAAAHASLISTDPAQGSVVATLPDEITLTFNEPVRLESGGITAFDANGDEWSVEAKSSDNLVLVTPVDDPGDGTVVISWKVTSEDGHVVSGAVHFSIGAVSSGGPDAVAPEAPTATSLARFGAAGLAGLGLLASIVLAWRRSPHADMAWNVGLLCAVLLGPLHALATEGRGLGGLADWVAWIDGLTSRSSLLLLGGFVFVAAFRRLPVVALVPALGLLVGAAVVWPQPEAPAVAAVAADPSPSVVSGDLGDAGSVELTVTRGDGRDVTLAVRLLVPDGSPLKPFAVPTLTVGNGDISLGEAELTETGPGAYQATVTIPIDGEWTADVSVRTSEFDNPVVPIPFSL